MTGHVMKPQKLFVKLKPVTVPVIAATAAITTTAATVAAAAAAGPKAATRRLGPVFGLLNYQLFFAKCNILQAIDGFVCFFIIGHLYKCKAPALASFFIHGHFGRSYGTKLFKNFHQFGVIQIIGETGYKKIHDVTVFGKSKHPKRLLAFFLIK
jgi:hypothetical protein